MPSTQSVKQNKAHHQDDNPKIVTKLEDSNVLADDANIAIIERTYKILGTKANKINENELFTSKAEDIRALNENISSNLKELKEHPDTKYVKSLEEEISKLSALTTDFIKIWGSRQGIEPRLSIIRPDVILIDAGLAYKFADLQSDATNLTSFATLFLGTTVASFVSFVVSYTAQNKDMTALAIYLTTALISIIVTALFGVLAFLANKKAKQARTILERKDSITEINLIEEN